MDVTAWLPPLSPDPVLVHSPRMKTQGDISSSVECNVHRLLQTGWRDSFMLRKRISTAQEL